MDFESWMNKRFPRGEGLGDAQKPFEAASTPVSSPPPTRRAEGQPLISGSDNVGVVTGSTGTGLHPDDLLHPTDKWDTFKPAGRDF
jgi:hypothetical protein